MKKQIYNPYLPLEEYVPDAEPHVFDGRVYVYGSHDREDGETFCMLDYVCYSAPVEDLRSWRYEGVIYQAAQDPDYRKKDSIYSPVVRVYQGLPKEYTSVQEAPAELIAEIPIPASDQWISQEQTIPFAAGEHPLYLVYQGEGEGRLLEITFSRAE